MNTASAISTPQPSGPWFCLQNEPAYGLGQADLMQSGISANQYKAILVLNSYESNCARDWLSLRWKSGSLQNTSIAQIAQSRLSISRMFTAEDVCTAKLVFQGWLTALVAEREAALQSRK